MTNTEEPITANELVTSYRFIVRVRQITPCSIDTNPNQLANDSGQTENKLRSIHMLLATYTPSTLYKDRYKLTVNSGLHTNWHRPKNDQTSNLLRHRYELTTKSDQTYPKTACELITKKDQIHYEVPSHQLRTNQVLFFITNTPRFQ